MLPTLATYNKNAARFDHPVSLPAIDGEVRDAKWINTAKGKIMAIARNNKGIVFETGYRISIGLWLCHSLVQVNGEWAMLNNLFSFCLRFTIDD